MRRSRSKRTIRKRASPTRKRVYQILTLLSIGLLVMSFIIPANAGDFKVKYMLLNGTDYNDPDYVEFGGSFRADLLDAAGNVIDTRSAQFDIVTTPAFSILAVTFEWYVDTRDMQQPIDSYVYIYADIYTYDQNPQLIISAPLDAGEAHSGGPFGYEHRGEIVYQSEYASELIDIAKTKGLINTTISLQIRAEYQISLPDAEPQFSIFTGSVQLDPFTIYIGENVTEVPPTPPTPPIDNSTDIPDNNNTNPDINNDTTPDQTNSSITNPPKQDPHITVDPVEKAVISAEYNSMSSQKGIFLVVGLVGLVAAVLFVSKDKIREKLGGGYAV